MQGNTVLGSLKVPIQVENPGPLVLLDNFLTAPAGRLAVQVRQAYVRTADADVVAVGNTVAATVAFDVQGRLLEADSKMVSTITAAVPPAVPTARARLPIVDVALGADATGIQQAINQAVANYSGQHPIVHLPSGTFTVKSTLTLPANSDVQLSFGDGATSVLKWGGVGAGPMIRSSARRSSRSAT